VKKLAFVLIFVITAFAFVGCQDSGKDKGALHAFSVSATSQVYFAESNLQYNAYENKWRFAENAYDIIGQANDNVDENYNGYIDLFCWGATGYNQKPYSTITDNTYYGDGAKDATQTNYDFGVYLSNEIGAGYRMFTHTEIHYMLMFRKNADKLFGYGQIGDTKGLFILPDDYKNPEGITFVPSTQNGFTNQYDWYWSCGDGENYFYNKFSYDDWNKLKGAGAVFLPTVGMRYGNETSHVGISGHYWTSSHYGSEFANCLCLFEKDLFLEGNFDRSYALGVRLVKDAK